MKAAALGMLGIRETYNGHYDLYTAGGIYHFHDLWPAVKVALTFGMRGL